MSRGWVLLLAVAVALVIASSVGSLARPAQSAGRAPLAPAQPADTPTPAFFLYLPLVARSAPLPSWVNVVEEGFEGTPGPLWKFYDRVHGEEGLYYWAARDCRPWSGGSSAWAVGGGVLGAELPCGSNYPDNVDAWMQFGPFSLADATAAKLSFRLWFDVGSQSGADDFCIYAAPDDSHFRGYCLTYQTGDWSPLTFDLDNDLTGVNMLGQPQVWIALRFTSDEAGNAPEGAYVDDVVIRKCVGGTCPPPGSADAPSAAARRAPDSPPRRAAPHVSGR